jgi:hypothetical protein
MAEDETREPMAQGPRHNATSARQGIKTGAMRYVLGISLVLTVVALVVAWYVVEG